MSRKRITIGESTWEIHGDHTAVKASVNAALRDGTVAELTLLDGAGRELTVLVNGKVTQTVVFDLDQKPKPSEISGSPTGD